MKPSQLMMCLGKRSGSPFDDSLSAKVNVKELKPMTSPIHKTGIFTLTFKPVTINFYLLPGLWDEI